MVPSTGQDSQKQGRPGLADRAGDDQHLLAAKARLRAALEEFVQARRLNPLDRKLAREVVRMRGQVFTIGWAPLGSALGATLDLDDLLELILGKLTELLDAERAATGVVRNPLAGLVRQFDQLGVVGSDELVEQARDRVRALRVELDRVVGARSQEQQPELLGRDDLVMFRDQTEQRRYEARRPLDRVEAVLEHPVHGQVPVIALRDRSEAIEGADED